MQSRTQSFIESFVNVFIGFATGLIGQLVFLPMFGVNIPFGDNMKLALIFTVISIVRGYVVRRWFNKREA